MDLRSLACFLVLAEELHFHRAARRLNLTQPALSQRLRLLEDQLGARLLDRNRRHVALTPAGAAFLGPARLALAHAEDARVQALRAVRGEVGRLRLGFTVIAFYGALPEAVRLFRGRFPEVAVELAEMNSPALEQALIAGAIDLGVLHPPLSAPGLAVRGLAEQRLVLALPEAHPLARQQVVAVADLRDEPLLIAPRRIGSSIYDRILGLFLAADFSPRIVQEVSPMTTLTGLVAAGAGMGLVTAGIATVLRPGVAFRPLLPEPPALPMAAAWREPGPSPAAANLLALIAGLEAGP